MTPLALLLVVALAQDQEPKAKAVPKDSVEVLTRGCLKGRVFTATPRPADEGAIHGPDVTGHRFRVAGPKDVMALVKQHDGHLVEVDGIVRKAALGDEGLGVKVGHSRVVVGAPGGDPGRMAPPTPGSEVPTMDSELASVSRRRLPHQVGPWGQLQLRPSRTSSVLRCDPLPN